jgi:hypothetical protein
MELEPTTIERILSDPDFDPRENDLIGQALVAFMKANHKKVAQNEVAVKWLLKDKNVAHEFVSEVDITNPHVVRQFLRTMKRSSFAHSALPLLFQRLKKAMTDEVFEEVLDSVDNLYHLHWFEYKPGQRERMVTAFKVKGVFPTERKDWWEAFRTPEGLEWFINLIPNAAHSSSEFLSWANEEFLNLVSQAAKALQGRKGLMPQEAYDALATTMLKAIERRWPESYVCFCCGKGNGVDKKGRSLESNKLKSLTGYSLHRLGTDKKEGCDPGRDFQSPHEILLGHPRKFVYTCDQCGEPFTTKSGRTLHKKTCWR